ncbi:hypothetical protein TNCV_1960251 [Trichonephila clavipes]|nr:hypothetical protein TNCV_1960251 [Trichonephila clavipes]
MVIRRQRTEYQQLNTKQNRILEQQDLSLRMRPIVTRVGREVSTIQRCVTKWMQDHLNTYTTHQTLKTDSQNGSLRPIYHGT